MRKCYNQEETVCNLLCRKPIQEKACSLRTSLQHNQSVTQGALRYSITVFTIIFLYNSNSLFQSSSSTFPMKMFKDNVHNTYMACPGIDFLVICKSMLLLHYVGLLYFFSFALTYYTTVFI